MKKSLLVLFFILNIIPAFSCINLYDYRLKGGLVETDEYSPLIPTTEQRRGKIKEVKEYLAQWACKINWTNKEASDYAALLMMDFQFEKAQTILDTLLQKDSLNYTYNSNYGTLMELMGNNMVALKFIKRSVQIDPHSHQGSEWIHVKILEAKIAMQNDDQWSRHHHVLGDDLKASAINELVYQLNERTYFIQPKDFVVCDLLYTLGETVVHHDRGVILAREAFGLSMLYGDWNRDACEKRLYQLSFYPSHYYEDDLPFFIMILFLSFLLLFTLAGIWIYKKVRHRRSTQ